MMKIATLNHLTSLVLMYALLVGCDAGSNVNKTEAIVDIENLKGNNQDTINNHRYSDQVVYQTAENDEFNRDESDDKLCVIAKSGLIFRDKPDGIALGKFSYGEQLNVNEHTDISLTINDGGNQVTGEWLGVLTKIEGKNSQVYVFGGFLVPCFESNIPVQLIKKVSTPILEKEEKKVVIFTNHDKEITTYNHQYKPTGKLQISKISYAKQLAITAIEHPFHTNADYCDYAKFVKILYKNQEYILFGKDVFEIEAIQKLNFKGRQINMLRIKDYAMGISDEQGLTSCANGASYVLIEDNNQLHTVGKDNLLVFVNDDMQSEKENKYQVFKDSIKTEVNVVYTDQAIIYTLSIFENKGWDFKIYNQRNLSD